jgi:16S rRNA U1498 N3-methylase RsmE
VCEKRGAEPLGLGAWTLRAETAAALAAGFVSPES